MNYQYADTLLQTKKKKKNASNMGWKWSLRTILPSISMSPVFLHIWKKEGEESKLKQIKQQ